MANQQTMHEIESELSLFLKRVRQREDEHFRLLDYTSKMLAKSELSDQSSPSNSQIAKGRQFLKERIAMDSGHQEKDFALAAKCEAVCFEEEDSLLTRRVAARILELAYNAIELRRESNEYYSAFYSKFKENCLKGLAESKAKPAWIIRLTNRYLTTKMQIQLERLHQALNFWEVKDFQSLGKMKSGYYGTLKRKEMQNVVRQNLQKNIKAQIINQSQKPSKKQQSDNPQKQSKKQLLIRNKVKSIKDEQKQSLKHKKQQAKKLKKLASSLSEVMDICRQQFLQQLAPDNKIWQARRMLHDLVTRNKSNQNYINAFREKQWEYSQKINRNSALLAIEKHKLSCCLSLQEQLVEKSERGQQEMFTAFTTKEIRISQPVLNKKETAVLERYERKEGSRLATKSGHIKNNNVRQRSTLNSIPENQKLKKERQVFSSQKQIFSQQDFVQINFKAPVLLPKARFPEIHSRIVSVEKKPQNIKKEEVVRTKLELKATGINFFEEIEKRISKFCQMKRNLLA